jgi:NTE family protein
MERSDYVVVAVSSRMVEEASESPGVQMTSTMNTDTHITSPGGRTATPGARRSIDLVCEGGGVKGLGAGGAVATLLDAGYQVERAAGTSVGAIAAAVAAAGADSQALRRIMDGLSLAAVPDRGFPGVPLISEGIGLLRHRGAFRGDYVRDWLAEELENLGVTTFKSLRRKDPGDDQTTPLHQRWKLVVHATDVTHGRLLRLPWDYKERFGLNPDEQLVADAVRMSLSIPLFFEPCTLNGRKPEQRATVVDGGVLSNFPVQVFDRTDGQESRWPTWGVRLVADLPGALDTDLPGRVAGIVPPVQLAREVIATALLGHDQSHLDEPGVRERMISVNTSGVGITEFGIDEKKKQMLFDRGRDAAGRFLREWATAHP